MEVSGADAPPPPERRRWRPCHAAGLPVFVASILCSVAFAAEADVAASGKKAGNSRKAGLSIRVEGNEWGSASRQEIETVLYAVADELLAQVPKKLNVPIVVTPTQSNPMVLYERGRGGEYVVHLHAKGPRWHLYAYEFAHELCHIMSNYEENAGADVSRYNQWFEEALCESASLYTLRSLAARWEKEAPSPEWAARAAGLRAFAERLVSEEHRRLPSDLRLVAWLQDNEGRLRKDPYLRDKNEVVANLLLPLFERHPEGWRAIGYLNRGDLRTRRTFQDYLSGWYAAAPPEHRQFIGDVLTLLGVMEPAAVAVALAPPETATAEAPAAGAGGHAGPIAQ